MMCCGLYATQMQRVAQRFIGIGFCMLSISDDLVKNFTTALNWTTR